ncbi:MAG: hypothetical protein AAB262_13085 [Elusimicrobiota bacterium]
MLKSLLCLTLLAGFAAAADAPKEFPADKGPDKIDVSKYPQAQRKAYTIVEGKCSKCHTFARAVGSAFVTKEEWTTYVTKMSKKKRSGIRAGDIALIADFLSYDSGVRKVKPKAATPEAAKP